MKPIQNFMVDPPWPKKKGGKRRARPNQGRQLDYPTMSIGSIFRLLDREIFPLAQGQPHNVWLWGVDQYLMAGEHQLIKRGYRLHARIIWNKTNGIAPAFTLRYAHEYLCWFYKPKFLPIDPSLRGKFTDVITEVARQHSRKPDAAYNLVKSLYPSLKCMDVFSREKRSSWKQWGNELDHFSG